MTHLPHRLPLLLAAAVIANAVPARAAVHFEPWADSSFAETVDRAAREGRPVVLVVTQPDWCPPCIKLDEKWLRNEADSEGSRAVGDAMVLEVRGYDADGAALLRAQRIQFQGTPTTLVFAAPIAGEPLGRAPLTGTVVGAPDDWPARVASLLAGEDPIDAVQARIDDAANPLERAQALSDLGDLLAARGDVSGAMGAYRRVEWVANAGLDDGQRAELQALKRRAAWERAATVDLRVRKDYRRALAGIDAWRASYVPTRFRADADVLEEVAYARAWALQGLGRNDEALDELARGLPATADGYESFLYFAFRSGDPEVLLEGERRASEALELFPERRASLLQALGRIQRRQGRLADAEASFTEAVALAAEGEQRMVYASQLETVRREREAAGQRPLHLAPHEAPTSSISERDAARRS